MHLGQRVNLDAHGRQFDAGDLSVNLGRHRIDFLLQLISVLDHVLGSQRLVGKGHVHDRGWVAFGGRKVDQAALAKQVDAATIFQLVLLDERAHQLRLALREFLQRRNVDLDVEMPGVRNDGVILHCLEVLPVHHIDVAGQGTEEIADPGCLCHRHDLVAIHDRFKRLERIHLGDDDQRTHAACPRGQAASAPAIAGDDEVLTSEQHVRRPDDAVHGGLACAVAVVEEVLGHGVVDRDDREIQHPIRSHGAQADDAGGGLFGAADDFGQQLAPLLVDSRDQVRAVVHGHVRLVVEGRADVLIVSDIIFTFDGKNRHLELIDQRGGHIILGGKRIGCGQHQVCAASHQSTCQVGGLGGDMQAG